MDHSSSPKPIHHVRVGIVVGSKSDLVVMQDAAHILKHLGVEFELSIVSAHRTPDLMFDYAKIAASRGLKVLIAGAGGAAHLPGMLAAISHLPVIGVPIKSSNSIDGWDSILSILQMPNGVPVATVALNAAKNAGLLAIQMLAISDEALAEKYVAYKAELEDKVADMSQETKAKFSK